MNNDIQIYSKENRKLLHNIPILTDEQLYIYCLLSSNGNIKIGKTTNIIQRIMSLSGSNGGGEKIMNIYVSPWATYLYSIEGTIHTHFNYCRIPSTEWFDGKKLNYIEAIEYIDGLFRSEDFKRCNELRKQIIEKKKEKEQYDNERD